MEYTHFGTRIGAVALASLALIAVGCGNSETPANGSGGSSGSGGISGAGGVAGANDGSNPAVPASGSFSWAINGQTFSTTGYYLVTLFDGSPGGTFTISSNYAALPTPCNLRGNFANVPPPAGTYPIGEDLQPLVTGTFVGVCNSMFQEASALGDASHSGQVILTKSMPNDIEGTFTMIAGPGASGSGGQSGQNTYTGSFAVTSSTEP